jgi:ribosomal protein S18 acetylase RimI-like enzyme
MPLILRRATAADASALTEIYFSAFSLDAASLVIFPRGPASFKWWYDSVIEEMQGTCSSFVCVYDSSSPNQKIVSYAKWNNPSAPVTTNLPEWPQGSDIKIANLFFGNLLEEHAERMKGRKHWYLEVIATRPEYQGKGAGGQLIRWGLEKVDEEGTETYLEASPHGKPIYERYGFREVDRLVVNFEKEVLGEKEFVEVFMLRPIPAPKGEKRS